MKNFKHVNTWTTKEPGALALELLRLRLELKRTICKINIGLIVIRLHDPDRRCQVCPILSILVVLVSVELLLIFLLEAIDRSWARGRNLLLLPIRQPTGADLLLQLVSHHYVLAHLTLLHRFNIHAILCAVHIITLHLIIMSFHLFFHLNKLILVHVTTHCLHYKLIVSTIIWC